jgi:hypothetical protein
MSRFVTGCCVLSVGVGLLALCGWMFHVPILTRLLPGQVAIRANAAACLVAIGFALWILRRAPREAASNWKPIARAAALLVSIVGLLSLLEFIFGWDFGIDQLLCVAGPLDVPGAARPGLVPPIAALSLFLLGVALFLLDSKTRFGRWPAQLLPFGVVIASMFGILDFVLEGNTSHTSISPVTGIVLFLSSFGLMLARTESGLGALAASATLGGTLTRRLVPAAIIVPLVMGWLRWKGAFAGHYSAWTEVAIVSLLSMVLLAGLTVWTASVIDRTEQEREQTAQARRTSEEQFHRLLDGSRTTPFTCSIPMAVSTVGTRVPRM